MLFHVDNAITIGHVRLMPMHCRKIHYSRLFDILALGYLFYSTGKNDFLKSVYLKAISGYHSL